MSYIPLSFSCIVKHIGFLFTNTTPELINKKQLVIYGYSCRSLFYTLLDVLHETRYGNKKLNILVSPIHHTSWRDIIEFFFDKDEITILPMNNDYNKIMVSKEIYSKSYDICIISHIFGQDIDTTELDKINSDCVFIEDRVQGGKFSKKYSSNLFDMSFYSCGMDKSPYALGGGLMYYKSNCSDIVELIDKKIKTYKKETRLDRSIFLVKKLPTYILYNFRNILYIFIWFIRIFGIDLQDCINSYRKINPGFTHTNYYHVS